MQTRLTQNEIENALDAREFSRVRAAFSEMETADIADAIEELESENAALQQGLDDLEARVAALETVTGASYSPQSEPLGGWLPFDRLRTFLLGGLMVAAGVVVKRRHSGGER